MPQASPARYRRILSEYVDTVVKSMAIPLDIRLNNRISGVLEDYVNKYGTGFVNSNIGEKAENQFRNVYIVAMLRLADILLTNIGKKLSTICGELQALINNAYNRFVDTYLEIYRTLPHRTVRSLYRSLLLHIYARHTIDNIAAIYDISVTTARTYIAQVRRVANIALHEELDEHGDMYPHLSTIVETCRQLNILPITYIPRGVFGTLFWRQVRECRFRSIWHLIAAMCVQGVTGVVCESFVRCLCYEVYYLPFLYGVLQGCEKPSWQLLDICSDDRLLRHERYYDRYVTICPDQYGLWLLFTDIDNYVEYVECRNTVFRSVRRMVHEWYTYAKSVQSEKYSYKFNFKCFEE